MISSSHTFRNENGVPYAHPGYTWINCLICGKAFIVGKGIVVRDCGDHENKGRPMEYA
mgnify:CR=1 FL=1